MIKRVQVTSRKGFFRIATFIRKDQFEKLVDAENTVEETLSYLYKNSKMTVVLYAEDDPIALFGVMPLHTFTCYGNPVWLIPTEYLELHKKQFLRAIPSLIEDLFSMFPNAVCHMNENDPKAKRFALWAGFKQSDRKNLLVRDKKCLV